MLLWIVKGEVGYRRDGNSSYNLCVFRPCWFIRNGVHKWCYLSRVQTSESSQQRVPECHTVPATDRMLHNLENPASMHQMRYWSSLRTKIHMGRLLQNPSGVYFGLQFLLLRGFCPPWGAVNPRHVIAASPTVCHYASEAQRCHNAPSSNQKLF